MIFDSAIHTAYRRIAARLIHNNLWSQVQILSTLKHPHIVRYHEAFVDATCICIAMEFCEGGDLQQFLRARVDGGRVPIPEMVRLSRPTPRAHLKLEPIPLTHYHLSRVTQEALSIMAQVALALQFCHKKQILHRDIKPSNVYLDKAGLLKLGDFGMARSLGESLAQTVVGTPYAMAPELCHSQPYSYKVRTPLILSYLHRSLQVIYML
jgi:serine/threonine protein kinase